MRPKTVRDCLQMPESVKADREMSEIGKHRNILFQKRVLVSLVLVLVSSFGWGFSFFWPFPKHSLYFAFWSFPEHVFDFSDLSAPCCPPPPALELTLRPGCGLLFWAGRFFFQCPGPTGISPKWILAFPATICHGKVQHGATRHDKYNTIQRTIA